MQSGTRICLLSGAVVLAVLACSSTPARGPADAGPGDAGFDAGPSALVCDVRTQQGCGPGIACMAMDAGLASACRPAACDLVRQSGCSPEQKCVYLADGGASARGCTANGTADAGEACSTAGTQCSRGLTCVQLSNGGGSDGTCQRFCYDDPDCPAGTECGDIYLLPPGTPESPSFCITAPPSCDLLSATGCPSQQACYSGPRRPTCYAQGAVPLGGACAFANDCVPGSLCTGTGSDAKCRQLCRFPDGGPSCATGVCTEAAIVGEANVGVCL